MNRIHTISAYILAVIAILCAAHVYLETSMKGFPDGHLTELERAVRPWLYALSFILCATGFFLVYLAQFAKWENRNKIFYRTILFLIAIFLMVFGLDLYFMTSLENGQGG